MKTLALSILGLFMAITITAQTYETEVSGIKSVEIKGFAGEIEVVGTDDNQLVIDASGVESPPEKAEGLKPLLTSGVDNTGIGLNADKSGNVLRISVSTKAAADAEFKFLIPNHLSLNIDQTDPWASDDLLVHDFSGELEIETLNPDIVLNNITGPVTLHAINGDVDLTFDQVSQDSPTSVSAINGDINFVIPSSTRVSFTLGTIHGDIYTDLDIKVEKEEDEEGEENDLEYIGGRSDVKGTLNGGGVEINLNAINANIYIREKE